MINHKLILFDGICNLCNGTVNFIIKRDSKEQFLFIALQSETGKKVVQKWKIPKETDSVILIAEHLVFTESEAIIEIAKLLPFPWKLAAIFKIIPKKTRDTFYRWIAKNRYRWFGKKRICRVPSPDEKKFFPEVNELKF